MSWLVSIVHIPLHVHFTSISPFSTFLQPSCTHIWPLLDLCSIPASVSIAHTPFWLQPVAGSMWVTPYIRDIHLFDPSWPLGECAPRVTPLPVISRVEPLIRDGCGPSASLCSITCYASTWKYPITSMSSLHVLFAVTCLFHAVHAVSMSVSCYHYEVLQIPNTPLFQW